MSTPQTPPGSTYIELKAEVRQLRSKIRELKVEIEELYECHEKEPLAPYLY